MQDIIRRFHSALPKIRDWIEQHLEAHSASASKLDIMPPLSTAFPAEILERALW